MTKHNSIQIILLLQAVIRCLEYKIKPVIKKKKKCQIFEMRYPQTQVTERPPEYFVTRPIER